MFTLAEWYYEFRVNRRPDPLEETIRATLSRWLKEFREKHG